MSKFDRVVAGAKKIGKFALSEDNPVGRGSKRIDEMVESKAKKLDSEKKPYKAGALRAVNDMREMVTPTSNVGLAALGAGVMGKAGGMALKGIKALSKSNKIKVGAGEKLARKEIESGNKRYFENSRVNRPTKKPYIEELRAKDKLNTSAKKASSNPEDFGIKGMNKNIMKKSEFNKTVGGKILRKNKE